MGSKNALEVLRGKANEQIALPSRGMAVTSILVIAMGTAKGQILALPLLQSLPSLLDVTVN